MSKQLKKHSPAMGSQMTSQDLGSEELSRIERQMQQARGEAMAAWLLRRVCPTSVRSIWRKWHVWQPLDAQCVGHGHRNRRPSSSLSRWRGCIYGDFWAAVNLFDSKRGRHATSFGCFRWNFPLKKKEMVPFQGRRYVRQQFRGGRGELRYGGEIWTERFALGILTLTSGHQKGPPMMSDDESFSDSSKHIPRLFLGGVGGVWQKSLITESKYFLTNHHQWGFYDDVVSFGLGFL